MQAEDTKRRELWEAVRETARGAYTPALFIDHVLAELEWLRSVCENIVPPFTHVDVAMLRAQADCARILHGPDIADAFDLDDLAGRLEPYLSPEQ